MDLNAVEAGFLGTDGGVLHILYHPPDLLRCHLAADVAGAPLGGGGADGRPAGDGGGRVGPGMRQLEKYSAVRLADRLGHLLKPGQKVVAVSPELPGAGLAFGADVGMAADDETDGIGRQFAHFGNQRGRHAPVVSRQTFPDRGAHEAVFEGDAVEGGGFKQCMHGGLQGRLSGMAAVCRQKMRDDFVRCR